ncbi:hypothetical protein OROGR_016393 [Orobanche gracilis]
MLAATPLDPWTWVHRAGGLSRPGKLRCTISIASKLGPS